MPRYFWPAVSLVVAGLIIVIIPDGGAPLVTFNSEHGPSSFDIFGLVLFGIGWICLSVYVITRWKKVKSIMGIYKFRLSLRVYILGIFLIYFGLRVENNYLLWIGIFFSASSNILLIVKAARVDQYS